MSKFTIFPAPGALRLLSEVEFHAARISWRERHAACVSNGGGVKAFDDLAFASETLWSAVQRELSSTSATIKSLSRRLIKPEFAGHDLRDVQPEAAAQMKTAVACDLLRLEGEARGTLAAAGLASSHSAVAAFVADFCEVHAICAGMMRQTYCSHRSERHASALTAMVLHPSVNCGELLPDEIRGAARALVPYAPQRAAQPSEMNLVFTPVRVSALRQRIWKDGRDQVQKIPSSREQISRYASLTFAEAASEMLNASPHKSGLETPHSTAGRAWSRSTLKQFLGVTKLVRKFFGERPVASLETHDWREFFAVLQRLPKDHHKSKYDEERSIEEICRKAAADVAEGKLLPDRIGLSDPKINQNITNIRTLYGWLARHIDLPEIMWAQFAKPAPKPSRDRAYSPDQLGALFRHPIYIGRSAANGSIRPGSTVWHNASYFVLLIIAYSGARLGEACGLRVTDIRKLGGIHYMALRDHKARELKRAASVRDIPLHPELIRLGFLDFVEALKAEGETLLFPELYLTGCSMAVVFAQLVSPFVKRDFEFMGKGEFTHGIRHYVNDLLKLADIPVEIRQALIGQSGKEDLSERTNSVANLVRLARAMEQLPVVTAHLRPEPILLHPAPLRSRHCSLKTIEKQGPKP